MNKQVGRAEPRRGRVGFKHPPCAKHTITSDGVGGAQDVVQLLECLPKMPEVLVLIPNTT